MKEGSEENPKEPIKGIAGNSSTGLDSMTHESPSCPMLLGPGSHGELLSP